MEVAVPVPFHEPVPAHFLGLAGGITRELVGQAILEDVDVGASVVGVGAVSSEPE